MTKQQIQIALAILFGCSIAFSFFCLMKAFMLMGPPPSALGTLIDARMMQDIRSTSRTACRELAEIQRYSDKFTFELNCREVMQNHFEATLVRKES